jgi:hypothetical protein
LRSDSTNAFHFHKNDHFGQRQISELKILPDGEVTRLEEKEGIFDRSNSGRVGVDDETVLLETAGFLPLKNLSS